jgi:hypothetical protein
MPTTIFFKLNRIQKGLAKTKDSRPDICTISAISAPKSSASAQVHDVEPAQEVENNLIAADETPADRSGLADLRPKWPFACFACLG